MVDSSVGGKTGINTRQGKNLVGSFYQPKLVLADISALESLNEREFLSGFAEVIKYGLINDREFFEWLNRNLNKILARDRSSIIHAIFKSCTAKAEIVAKDEREQDIRALLNLGHTFAHALELAVNFSGKLLHGEAVAIGMVLAFRFSAKSGLCSIEAAKVVEEFIAKTGLPNSLAQVEAELSAESLVNDMKKDKKAEGGKLNLILAKSIGDCFVAKDVAEMEVLEFLRGELE
jgi:3-dehydroquinate synthase